MAVDVVVVWEEGSTLDSAAGRDLLKPPPIRPPLRPPDFRLVFAFGGARGCRGRCSVGWEMRGSGVGGMAFVRKSTLTVSKPQRKFACGQGRAVKRLPRTTDPCDPCAGVSLPRQPHTAAWDTNLEEASASKGAPNSRQKIVTIARKTLPTLHDHPSTKSVAAGARSAGIEMHVAECAAFASHVPKGRGHKEDTEGGIAWNSRSQIILVVRGWVTL